MEERMPKLFAYGHLEREDLLAVSKPFAELAERVVALVPAEPERTVSLRKLLEAKDAAVRAVAIPEPPTGPHAPGARRGKASASDPWEHQR